MRFDIKSDLVQFIQRWINKHCEDNDWTDAYVYEELAYHMATAAEMVFEANEKGQKFAEDQKT